MRSNNLKARMKTVVLAAISLLLGAGVANGQVNLIAGPTTATLPDGTTVPMWGYSCAVVNATCHKLNPAAAGWSPVVITVAPGALEIDLTNNLSFGSNKIPTSLVIIGQLGGGLGKTAQMVDSPNHANQPTTWPIANGGGIFTPPVQGQRVQSFSTEVMPGGPAATLKWNSLRPGTYLIESGTHPSIQGPMGLYGILVVTTAPSGGTAGTAYPGVTYNADVPLLLSEMDPALNNAVNAAVTTVGFNENATYGPSASGPIANINVVTGGSGYTSAPNVNLGSTGTPNATATAAIDTDPTSPTYQQVTGISINGAGKYLSPPTVILSGGGGSGATATAYLALANSRAQCSGGASACYPPVVNYRPLYYMINGSSFDKTNASHSLFAASPSGVTGKVLVRFVNAGLRMHVPSIVGSQTGSVGGFSLIAEDGNVLPGTPRVQNEVFMAAGKTYDVMINVPTGTTALPVYDRQLSLSSNSTGRDAGMLAYISVNGGALPAAAAAGLGSAVAKDDTYNSVIAGKTLTVSDLSLGVIANDINVYGVHVSTPPSQGTLKLAANGTFQYIANVGWTGSDSFKYCGNGASSGQACATVLLGPAPIEAASGITCGPISYTSGIATFLAVKTPGVLASCKDAAGYPLTVDKSSITATNIVMSPNGGFTATAAGPGLSVSNFTFQARNSQGTLSAPVNVNLTFLAGSGLNVTVLDGADKTTKITDYRWIIEEDRTFYVDPKCTTKPQPAGCPKVNAAGAPPIFGTNFHTSNMPVVAAGCTGPLSCESGQTLLGQPAVCDQGNGECRTDASAQTAVDPRYVVLDPTKRYYISVFPGDAAQPFIAGYGGAPTGCSATAATSTGSAATDTGNCGHGMGGAPIAAQQTSVTVLTQPTPLPPATLSVFVFEDDYPLNGEHDAGGGIDVLSPDEPGLGGFQITLADSAGATGDSTGAPTYDMFNQPLSNSLVGTIDPASGFDACPVSAQGSTPVYKTDPATGKRTLVGNTASDQAGITGMIITCPKYESDGKTLSPLAGQAIVKNLYPGRYGVIANPGADRLAQGEEWLQTNTLDGQKAHDSFLRVGEPGYFQEFGPGGFHVTIGFANPKVINDRLPGICTGATCTNEVKGHVSTARMSRTPDERLYGSGSHDAYAFTQCYASLGDPDGADFAFVKCDADGNFDFKGVPAGNWKLTLFDQWNDQVVDGIATPVGLANRNGVVLDLGEVAVHQWQDDIYTRTFFDLNGDGVSTKDNTGTPCTATNTPAGCNANYGNDKEPGLALAATNIRFPDGSYSNFNNTDLNGYAGFNEVFPLFNWYVIESDSTRYKNTGTHVVYDAGGPTDGTTGGGTSTIAANFANTIETIPVPTKLRVPGAVYCSSADCTTQSIATGPIVGGSSGPGGSTGRIDPPWVVAEGWQGFAGQSNFLEFGKKPFAEGENGGIRGHVVYASTRPFDDPQRLLQLSWEPLVPHVTINLYKEGKAPDGTTSLSLVDTTQTSSFDDWAQGFRSDGIPNMNCPGQATTDPFFYGLKDQPNYLDWYNSLHGGPAPKALPNNAQFKCYDGMHNWNQLQPAPYDGMYQFPSVTAIDPITGKVTATNCTACVTNPDATDPYRYGGSATPAPWTPSHGTPMLPDGKYVVEVVVPPNFELVKEEDKNILIGDNYIAPVVQQFGGLGNVFILPDQAEIQDYYNANNAQDSTQNLGRLPNLPSHESDTGSDESYWPCVGTKRQVPDYISLFPGSAEVAPFAGATRPLCDRKEVSLDDQTSVLAKFYVFTSTHIASKFTGVITDDFDAEFDPFSPQFGEKFAPAYLPVSIKDWAGNEISRVYSDQFGIYNGMNYSTWEVNPPNPTGYAPTMMVTCMNDPGKGKTPDPLFQPGYSNFCYELPYMPGATGYFDTPVVPTSAFGGGYNHPDCAYPDATPAIASVISNEIAGPWVSASGAGHTLTITALGDQLVENSGYSGPNNTNPKFNKEKMNRHYGFGDTAGTVTIGGVNVPLGSITTWNDTTITLTVPAGVPDCAVQQQPKYAPGATSTQCGQLVITAANGKQSVDTVTVTIGGKMPTVVDPAATTIQTAIDAAQPGDMIIVPPGTYTEMLIMWKPVRLQGVGATSSIIDANPHPAGKLNPWRQQIVCLFGLALNGTPISSTNPYDPNTTPLPCTADMQFSVDRLPLEATVGWDASLNGNLAEQLIEPSLMGAYEGAGVTVLAKGVKFPTTDPAVIWASDTFPTGTQLLTHDDCLDSTGLNNPYPSNFFCNPSRIDGFGVTNSSQGGGGILVHAWGHNIEIANNRVHSNQGTLSGGITVGQGEHPDLYTVGATAVLLPGSCETGTITNQGLPYCFDMHVNVHNNAVTLNSSLGDELFSSTPAGAGGVTFCNGSDYYKFNYNWVCGNMSTGDGAGVAHLGFTKNGSIEHNSILFNESTNPSITTNGGGLLVMGAPDQDPPCNTPVGKPANDNDCVSPANTLTPSDGTGPGLVINANLIMGNSADAGSGGGLRLQHINGTDVLNFPNGARDCNTPGSRNEPTPGSAGSHYCLWNSITVTNNIITNNVAGWDGGGVSMIDALAVNIINNTIVSNDTTAIAGPLFGSLFAPLASTPGVNCTTNGGTFSCPQVAGLVSVTNSPVLVANLPRRGFTCPPGHGTAGGGGGGGGGGNNGSCSAFSVPLLANNIIFQNRSFQAGLGGIGAGGGDTTQQRLVSVYNSSFGGGGGGGRGGGGSTLAASQTSTGACPTTTPPSYWDLGVRGDTGPNNHAGNRTLGPLYSVLTSTAGYGGTNSATNPALNSKYCDGSRTPPELGTMGYSITPGTNETNALPTPIFSLTTTATVDEGNNWVNLRWGPLSMFSPVTGAGLSDYTLSDASTVKGMVPANEALPGNATVPSEDFYGNPRPDTLAINSDPGAVEWVPVGPKLYSISPNPVYQGTTVTVTLVGSKLLGVTAVNVSGAGITVSNIVVVNSTTVTATFGITATAALGARTVTVTNPDGTSNPITLTVALPPLATLTSITPNAGIRGLTYAVTLTGTNFVDGLSTLAITGTGVAISAVTVNDPTTITATFAVSTTASLGADNVTVVNGSQISAPVTFTVVAPTLTSITPSSGLRSTTVPVTLVGLNLTGATSIAITGTGVTITGFTAVSDTTVTANFVIAANATLSARNVTVVNSGGAVSNAVVFTVSTPTLTSITPSSAPRGSVNLPVTLIGTGFLPGTTVAVGGAGGGGGGGGAGGVTVGAVTIVDPQTITTTFTITATAALGARNVTVTNAAGTSNAVVFTVAGPTLTSISPTSGSLGSTVPVTLSGFSLTGATAITVSGNGGGGGGGGANNVTCTIAGTPQNDTTVTANCVIPAGAAATVRNIAVVTPIGTTNTVPFTVTVPAPPTLTSIAPISGRRGGTVPISLTGTNFITGGTTIAVSGGGVTCTVTGVGGTSAASTATANCVITAGAAATARTLTVTTPGGTSNSLPFTVLAAVLNSIAPTTGVRGTVVNVTLTGANLTGATAVNVAQAGGGGGGTGITVSNLVVVSDTTVTATFTIGAGAAIGTDNVSVTAPDGTSNTVTFTVAGPALNSIAPNTGTLGSTVPVTLSGLSLTGATAITVSGNGGGGGGGNAIVCTIAGTPQNDTTVTASCVIPAGAAATVRNIAVVTPNGTTNTVPFTVAVPAAPILTGINPATGAVGTTVPITLTGTNLLNTTAINVSGNGGGGGGGANNVTVTGLTVVNATTVTANLVIPAGAAATARSITVTTPGGTSNAETFTVLAAPTLTTIAPTTGTPGNSVNVTLTGTNLIAGATVAATGTGVTVSNVVVVSATSITATLTIASTAPLAAGTVSVTTAGGTSNPVTFTVAPPAPTLASIAPAAGTQGSTITVTLTGTNLTGATINVSRPGGGNVRVTVGAVTVNAAGTTASASFTIAGNAALGARNVSVTTSGGTTGNVTFTVN